MRNEEMEIVVTKCEACLRLLKCCSMMTLLTAYAREDLRMHRNKWAKDWLYKWTN